ncbi:MAG: 3-keto-5-aminohexanoate cleavage protein [Myxococcota bacterium]
MSNKLIITAAICGAETTRKETPHLPVTAKELGDEARRCLEAGASIIHLHVRKPDGTPTQELGFFRDAFIAIRDACLELPIIQPSTGGAVGMTFDERAQPLELCPEMATLDCGTVNFGDEIFVNDLPMMRAFADRMVKIGTIPELECFDLGHIHNAEILIKEGRLRGHCHFDLVLGVPGAMNGSADSLFKMVSSLPAGATWTVAGVGRFELPLACVALGMGGHVRVGLEDNIFYRKGELSKGNAPLVERIVRIARELGREPAAPDEAREMLGIAKNRKNKIKFE